MTPEQTNDLLTFAEVLDPRIEYGTAAVAAWHLVIGDLDFADAQAALAAHYQESRYRVMPADIRHRVKTMRRDRLERTPIEAPPPELTDDPAGYKAELDRRIEEIARGWTVPAIDRPGRKAVEGRAP